MSRNTIQIKVSLTAEEKERLEQEAKERGVSVSSLAHDRLFQTVQESERNVQSGKIVDTHVTFPKSLYESLKEDAKQYGYSTSKYISLLLAQKGKPVILEFNYLDSVNQITALNRLASDFRALANMAEANKELTNSNIRTIQMEADDLIKTLKDCIRETDKGSRSTISKIQKELNREVEKVKRGSSHADS